MRRRVLHALALRAQAQPPGALRDKLIATLQRRASMAPAVHWKQERPPFATPFATPLADLLALLPADAGQELRQVRIHHGTWRQLRMARSLADLNAPIAGNLGPLNGQALATRALQQIQALAPDYLHRLLTQMDAIAALELLQPPGDADKPARAARKKAAERRR